MILVGNQDGACGYGFDGCRFAVPTRAQARGVSKGGRVRTIGRCVSTRWTTDRWARLFVVCVCFVSSWLIYKGVVRICQCDGSRRV